MKVLAHLFFVAFWLVVLSVNAQRRPEMPVYDSLIKNEKVVPLQFGFVHPIGSNGVGNTRVYNQISINALAGQSKGVLGTELSGLYSGNSGHAIGFKGTGLVDLVGGSLNGFQASGLVAVVGGNTEGMQAGGLLSANGGDYLGFQAGGLIAANRKTFDGMQAAGLVSLNKDNFTGFQASGLVSLTGDTLEGMQAAGLVSVCGGRVDGLQTAGLVNVARHLRGVQIGLINIADSADENAVTIGVVNIVRRNGLLQLGVMHNEFMHATVFLKSGTRFFHGYVGIGSQLGGSNYRFAPMIGAGTSVRLANRLYVEPGWGQWLVCSNGRFTNNGRMNNVQQFRLLFTKSFGDKGFSVSAGPTVNLLHSSYRNAAGETGLNLAPSYFYNKTYNNGVNVRGWVGYTVTVSFGRN